MLERLTGGVPHATPRYVKRWRPPRQSRGSPTATRIRAGSTPHVRVDRNSMALQQRLQTRLSQKLILTPALQQAIKLLPMTTLELVDMLNQEMVENPMLEEIPDEELQQPETASPAEKPEEPPADAEKRDSWDDADYEYFFGDYLDDGYRARVPRESRSSRGIL